MRRILHAFQDLGDLAFELNCALRPVPTEPSTPTWTIRDTVNDMRIVWPSQYGWVSASKWFESLLSGLRRYVSIETAPIPQPYPGVTVFELHWKNEAHSVAIDYSDRAAINTECAAACRLYFKMQYQMGGYTNPQVVPGGFVPGSDRFYHMLPQLRAIHDAGARYDVYGRFSDEFGQVVREKAIRLLTDQRKFRFHGGFGKVRYSRYLREAAQSRICIDLPGNGSFCFRLIEYLAMGACVISPGLSALLHERLEAKKHIVLACDDLSDLVELCAYYLENAPARERISQESRKFFDRYLHKDQLAAYYLYMVASCLSKPKAPAARA